MFKNYFLIALRTIATNRLFSIINILGLALGLASCMLIMQFVNYERSYDTHWQDADRIYRMSRHYPKSNNEIAGVPATLKPLLETSFPDVASVTHLSMEGDTWRTFMPHRAIHPSFLDERFNVMYDNEEKQASMFLFFHHSQLSLLLSAYMVWPRLVLIDEPKKSVYEKCLAPLFEVLYFY